MRNIMVLSALLMLAGVAFAQDITITKAKKVYTAIIDKDGVQKVEVVAGEYFFEPDHIIVKVNLPVEMMVRKKGGIVPHTIVINAPDAGIEIKESLSAEPKVIKFTPKKAGKYPLYCDKKPPFFKSHREKGMEGIIEVVEQMDMPIQK